MQADGAGGADVVVTHAVPSSGPADDGGGHDQLEPGRVAVERQGADGDGAGAGPAHRSSSVSMAARASVTRAGRLAGHRPAGQAMRRATPRPASPAPSC